MKNHKKNERLIITSGYFFKQSLEAADKIKNLDVINLFRFKNFNKKNLLKIVKNIKKYLFMTRIPLKEV